MLFGMMNNPRVPILTEIERTTKMDFDFIDLTIEAPGAAPESTDWRAVHAALRDQGLRVVAHAAPYLPLNNPSPVVRQAALDELRRCLDIAHSIGAPLCTTHFVGWPNFLTEELGYEYYKQAYQLLLKHGAEQGVQVTLENSPDNKHQLKYFREIFFRLPELKLTFDIGHGNVNTARSMTRDYLFALADRLVHVHLSDNDGSAADHLPFGAPRTGAIKLKHELQMLRDFRYDGTVTLEIFGHERWLLASRELVRERLAELG
ncbi:sugar phosphate isomerase/epimerase family protein [Caldilinea sp.]|uniref:sugar phosphate isomerase/epimerase family protein n=1 Tax=Caldilinea sp. TaxID=2293560 RepID=UPI002D1CE589|nr:sugar phosphate isomerase/epimerase [Anaerolineales bacterium]HQY92254.1 sugar phosphate isomerase/epimerase family protein [Caldilinea sp.]HRA67461.1 sugar phosphate isomerase/epimerase family protein [Caldilinea sp.]